MVDASSPANPQSWPIEMFDRQAIMNIAADPDAYQFRLGAKTGTGEVASHTFHDTDWNPLKHGAPLLLHKRKDGKYYVVDGHHRLAFAKRLIEEGKGPEKIVAYVMEEEKGISVKDAKIIAALLDISGGRTPVSDIAGVVKELAEPDPSLHQNLLPKVDIPPQAYKLASLSYGSLAKISRGEVPQEAALMVVDRVDDPQKRERVMEIIGQKLRQDYPNYQPNHALAQCLSCTANDNQKSFVEKLSQQRAQKSTVLAL